MKIRDPFQMNDWEIKRFLAVVLSIQAVVGILIVLEAATGLQVPVVRQLVSFVYLTFVPGILILRVLKLHKLGSIQALLYSVGLSLATVMFTGLLMNTVYPSLGTQRPISIVPSALTLGVIVLGLCILSYVRDRGFADPDRMDVGLAISPPVLFLVLIPLLSILGTQLVNFYQSNVLLMVLIIVIAFTVILIGFDKFIPRNLYPFAVFAIGLSLLLYRSLISTYISGFDIHEEYYAANLVIIAGRWEPSSTQLIVNSMLSITMLAPILSNIASIDLTWVLKVVYLLLFSFVPLGLYQIFRKQTDEKIAFLSCFFFIEAFQFYTELAGMLRQQIATIFIICLTLLMIDKRMEAKRASLFVIFGASLAVSHYGLSYVYMFYLISTWLIMVLIGNSKLQGLRDKLQARFGGSQSITNEVEPVNRGDNTVGITFCLLFIMFALSWYMYVQDARVFKAFTTIGLNIARSLNEFLNPEFSGGLNMLLAEVKPDALHYLNAAINYFNQIILIIGVIVLLLRYRHWKFTKEYTVFSVLSLAIIFGGVFLPFFTRQVNMDRLYHLALIFLAPLPIIGGLIVLRMINRVVKVSWKRIPAFSILSVYFVVFFLFQTGFVWQVTEGYSGSVSISQEGIKKFRDARAKGEFYSAITLEQDVFSAKWLSTHREFNEKIYAIHDDVSVHPLVSYGMIPNDEVSALTPRTEVIPESAYVYLQYVYVVEGIARIIDPGAPWEKRHTAYSAGEVSHLFAEKNKIYSNGGSEVYR